MVVYKYQTVDLKSQSLASVGTISYACLMLSMLKPPTKSMPTMRPMGYEPWLHGSIGIKSHFQVRLHIKPLEYIDRKSVV